METRPSPCWQMDASFLPQGGAAPPEEDSPPARAEVQDITVCVCAVCVSSEKTPQDGLAQFF